MYIQTQEIFQVFQHLNLNVIKLISGGRLGLPVKRRSRRNDGPISGDGSSFCWRQLRHRFRQLFFDSLDIVVLGTRSRVRSHDDQFERSGKQSPNARIVLETAPVQGRTNARSLSVASILQQFFLVTVSVSQSASLQSRRRRLDSESD